MTPNTAIRPADAGTVRDSALMLQAMGLGGWMFDGIDPFVMLGASRDPAVPGLGFRYDTNERWPYPNPTGLAGVLEGYCPPHYPSLRAAV